MSGDAVWEWFVCIQKNADKCEELVRELRKLKPKIKRSEEVTFMMLYYSFYHKPNMRYLAEYKETGENKIDYLISLAGSLPARNVISFSRVRRCKAAPLGGIEVIFHPPEDWTTPTKKPVGRPRLKNPRSNTLRQRAYRERLKAKKEAAKLAVVRAVEEQKELIA